MTHTATYTQAALLLDVNLRPLLSALIVETDGGDKQMSKGKSVSELAAELGGAKTGWPLRRVHYQVGKLQTAGIVQQVGVQPRAGRPIRHYAMPAPWFIPFEVTQSATLEGFLAAQIVPRTQQMVRLQTDMLLERQRNWGLWLNRGSLHLGNLAGPPIQHLLEGQPFISTMGTVRLSHQRALELKARLWALLKEFEDEEKSGEYYGLSLQFMRGKIE